MSLSASALVFVVFDWKYLISMEKLIFNSLLLDYVFVFHFVRKFCEYSIDQSIRMKVVLPGVLWGFFHYTS